MSQQRTQDRARATMRRDRQHGETEPDYQARVLKRAQEIAGDRYQVKITRQNHPTKYVLAAYGPGEPTPAIRIERETLNACANAFDAAAGRLAFGFAPSKK